MAREVMHIRSGESLVPLREEIRQGRRRRYGLIAVEVHELSESENKHWSERINQYYFACGCGVGAIFVVAALLLFTGWVWGRAGGFQSLSWQDPIWVLAAIFGAMGLGKAVGLAYASRQLRVTVHALEARLRVRGVATDIATATAEQPNEVRCAVK